MEPAVVLVRGRHGHELARISASEFDAFRKRVNGGKDRGSKSYALGISGEDGPKILRTAGQVAKLPVGELHEAELLKKARAPADSPPGSEVWRCV